jgi:hypothetical protein
MIPPTAANPSAQGASAAVGSTYQPSNWSVPDSTLAAIRLAIGSGAAASGRCSFNSTTKGKPMHDPRALTEHEQTLQRLAETDIRAALTLLRRASCEDEDIRAAMMHLADWLIDNEGRWTR